MKSSRTTLLLVEDNPDHSSLFMHAMGDACGKCRVVVLKHGPACLEYLGIDEDQSRATPERVPDVIFLDLKLPMVGGLELLEKIRNSPAVRNVPVIVLSSSRGPDLEESLARGANMALEKPLDGPDLRTALAEFCVCEKGS